MLRLDFDSETVKARAEGLVRHFHFRDILNMKQSPVLFLDGFDRRKTLAYEAMHPPAPNGVLDLDQCEVILTILIALWENHSVPYIGIECDPHRQTFSHRFSLGILDLC